MDFMLVRHLQIQSNSQGASSNQAIRAVLSCSVAASCKKASQNRRGPFRGSIILSCHLSQVPIYHKSECWFRLTCLPPNDNGVPLPTKVVFRWGGLKTDSKHVFAATVCKHQHM